MLNLPAIKLQILEDESYYLPNPVFSVGFSDYFLDLYQKKFNFNKIITNFINRNKKYHNLKLIVSTSTNPNNCLFMISIVKGMTKVCKFLLKETLIFQDLDVSCYIPFLLENGHFIILQSMMDVSFGNNLSKIFDFIMKHNLLMEIASTGNEYFLLQLMKEYIIPLGDKMLIPENKLFNQEGTNIFHYIAFNRMRGFLYCFLQYLLDFKFKSDATKMKHFLNKFLMMNDERTTLSSPIYIKKRTPIFYAVKNKFYEIINLYEISNIELGNFNEAKELFDVAEIKEIALESSFAVEEEQLQLLNQEQPTSCLEYFSKYMIVDDRKDHYKIEKNNYFHEKFQNKIRLLSLLKVIFNSNHNTYYKLSRYHSFCISYTLEALILGKNILEWNRVLMDKVVLFLDQSKEKAIYYLFFEIFPKEIQIDRSNLLFLQNEAVILYLFNKFFVDSKKAILTPFELKSKISKKIIKKYDVMCKILFSDEISNLLKLVQHENNLETIHTQSDEFEKLDEIKIYQLLIFCFQNKYKDALYYLMNLHTSEFLREREEYGISKSFFNEYLVYDAHLTYRLLKILEKSNNYQLLEKEFRAFIDNYILFDNKYDNLRIIIESFKVLILLISEEGSYNLLIFQIIDIKSLEDWFLSIIGILMNNVQNPHMIKNYLNTFAKEIQNIDYGELNYNYMGKKKKKFNAMFKYINLILNYLISRSLESKKRYGLDLYSLRIFVLNTIEEKLSTIEADCKHPGVYLCLGISFILAIVEGGGVYEDLCNEFENYEFVFFFLANEKGYKLMNNENGNVMKVNINEEIYFDKENYALAYSFNMFSYENLKMQLKEESFYSIFLFFLRVKIDLLI